MRARLYELATRDALTGAFNRRAFFERLASEWTWHRRHKLPCALLALDVDHFKLINDAHGHAAGDHVLKTLSGLMQLGMRAEDLFARIGGEEFVILARSTDTSRAAAMAERIRQAVENHPFGWAGTDIRVTVSIGVATSAGLSATNAEALVTRADAWLYRAKEQGRNRVVTDPSE
jgi:diguanylate cyclase (GGDEF)-like protein